MELRVGRLREILVKGKLKTTALLQVPRKAAATDIFMLGAASGYCVKVNVVAK